MPMDYTVIISVASLCLAAVAFFYGVGRDTKCKEPPPDDSKIDQIIANIQDMSKKIDKIADWQREAAGIHASHSEKIKTLFNRLENLENRMEDRQVINAALQKILERMS